MGMKFNPITGELDLVGSSGGGQTLYDIVVAPSGGDYTTLGAAIAAATSGQTIFVRSGSYTESALTSTTTDLTITGESMTASDVNIGANAWSLTGANLVIRNLKLNVGTGKYTFGGTNSIIEACYLFSSNTTSTTNTQFNISGQYIKLLDSTILTNSTTTSSSMRDIDWSGGFGVVNSNTFTTNATRANGHLEFRGVALDIGNNVFNISGSGSNYMMRLANSSIVFVGNTVYQGSRTARGIAMANGGGVVTGNNLRSLDYAAYDTGTASAWTFSGNVVNDCNNGIYVNSDHGSITGNNFAGRTTASGTGIRITANVQDMIISSNRVRSFAGGIEITAGATDVIVTSNNLKANTAPLSDAGTGTVSANNIV